jgi:hypothetical protein
MKAAERSIAFWTGQRLTWDGLHDQRNERHRHRVVLPFVVPRLAFVCTREWFNGRRRCSLFELRSHLVAVLCAPIADQTIDGAERAGPNTTSPTASDII